MFRAIEVICPPGTVGNGVLPAACAARGLTGFRMVDCMFGALAMMLPDKVKAAGDGGNSGISIGGYDAERKPFVYVEFTCGAWGARPWADGLNGNSHMFANQSCPSAEIIEAEQPVSVLAYEFVSDKAGAGKYRGGVPFQRDYRLNEAEAMMSVRSDRKTHRPFGLYGGSPGLPSENYLNPQAENRPLPSKVTMQIKRGDVFCHVHPGGGGWGDPLERDPAAVLKDVRNEFLSAGQGGGRLRRRRRHRDAGPSTRPPPSGARADMRQRRGWTRGAQGAVARPAAPAPRGGVGGMAGKTTYRVGVDIGGTFTDIVLLGSDGAVHTQEDLLQRRQLCARHRRGPGRAVRRDRRSRLGAIEEIRHGTTVASNAILEHKGAKVGLITTKGFRDVLEIRTLRMPRLYDIAWEKPPPLVERYLRRVVDERVDAKGHVERALDPGRCRGAGRCAAGREGRGDRRLPPQFVRQSGARADDQAISCSARRRACPSVGLLRGAAGDQGIRAHLHDRHQRLRDADRGHLSRRPCASASTPRSIPAPPAADAVERRAHDRQGGRRAAHEHHRVGPGRRRHRRAGAGARQAGLGKIITFDMGGTTAKASMVEDGEVMRAHEYAVGAGIMVGSRLLTGAGYTLKVPAIDLAEVGAGGGSHVWIDAGGALQVGPQSAGAAPGPGLLRRRRRGGDHHRRQPHPRAT